MAKPGILLAAYSLIGADPWRVTAVSHCEYLPGLAGAEVFVGSSSMMTLRAQATTRPIATACR